jgi:hypothetical protein
MPPAFCLAYRELYQGVGFFEGHGRTDELKELAWQTKNLVASNCQYYYTTVQWRLADRSDRYLTTCDALLKKAILWSLSDASLKHITTRLLPKSPFNQTVIFCCS